MSGMKLTTNKENTGSRPVEIKQIVVECKQESKIFSSVDVFRELAFKAVNDKDYDALLALLGPNLAKAHQTAADLHGDYAEKFMNFWVVSFIEDFFRELNDPSKMMWGPETLNELAENRQKRVVLQLAALFETFKTEKKISFRDKLILEKRFFKNSCFVPIEGSFLEDFCQKFAQRFEDKILPFYGEIMAKTSEGLNLSYKESDMPARRAAIPDYLMAAKTCLDRLKREFEETHHNERLGFNDENGIKNIIAEQENTASKNFKSETKIWLKQTSYFNTFFPFKLSDGTLIIEDEFHKQYDLLIVELINLLSYTNVDNIRNQNQDTLLHCALVIQETPENDDAKLKGIITLLLERDATYSACPKSCKGNFNEVCYKKYSEMNATMSSAGVEQLEKIPLINSFRKDVVAVMKEWGPYLFNEVSHGYNKILWSDQRLNRQIKMYHELLFSLRQSHEEGDDSTFSNHLKKLFAEDKAHYPNLPAGRSYLRDLKKLCARFEEERYYGLCKYDVITQQTALVLQKDQEIIRLKEENKKLQEESRNNKTTLSSRDQTIKDRDEKIIQLEKDKDNIRKDWKKDAETNNYGWQQAILKMGREQKEKEEKQQKEQAEREKTRDKQIQTIVGAAEKRDEESKKRDEQSKKRDEEAKKRDIESQQTSQILEALMRKLGLSKDDLCQSINNNHQASTPISQNPNQFFAHQNDAKDQKQVNPRLTITQGQSSSTSDLSK